MSSSPTFIYFVKPVEFAGPIKIGITNDMKVRMQSFSRYSPVKLEVAVSVPGSLALERSLHERFAYAHSHFEWFHPVDPLVSGIEGLKSGLPVERAFDLSIKTGSIRKNQPGVMARFTPQYKQRLSYHHKLVKLRQKHMKLFRVTYPISDFARDLMKVENSQTALQPLEISMLDAEVDRLLAAIKGDGR